MNDDPVVLSYRESLLRLSDVQLLTGPRWLNDTVISFYFEYLGAEKFKGSGQLLFVPPEVTQCIKLTPSSEMSVFLDPLHSSTKQFIFFALNDNEMTESSGGSHWSLLVFSQSERRVFHFDSSQGANSLQAQDLSEKLLRYFGLPYDGFFAEPMCLQQSNSYDCGIHVLCNAENIAEHVKQTGRVQGCSLLDRQKVQTKRSELLDLIESLRRQHR